MSDTDRSASWVDDSEQRFAADLKALRTQAQMSIRELERAGHTSRDRINQAELGRRTPTPEVTAAYVRGTGGSASDIASWDLRCRALRDRLGYPGQPSRPETPPGTGASLAVAATGRNGHPTEALANAPGPLSRAPTRQPPIWTVRLPRVAAAATVGALAIAVSYAATTIGGEENRDTRTQVAGQAPTSAQFISPVNGSTVSSPLRVTGSASIPADHSLWLLIRPPDGVYYTMTATALPITAAGQWSAEVVVGTGTRDAGMRYELILVVTPADGAIARGVADRSPTDFSARFPSLPSDTQVTHRVNVRLGPN